jgi:hypothetical protein
MCTTLSRVLDMFTAVAALMHQILPSKSATVARTLSQLRQRFFN